ncbi:MAG TPA: cytochrome b [Burkholderiaceae bacterium]|nr:cytochrome b [Burkholderiaceae bacterium]
MRKKITSSSGGQYHIISRLLHWLIAIMILGMLALGFYMVDLPLSPDKLKLYSWHKWTGVSIFLLVLLRLAWRFRHRPPAMPAHFSPAVRIAATAGHGVLYVLMLAIPLSGWLMSSAKGVQTVWFGVLPLPDLLPENEVLGDTLLAVHVNLNLIMLAAIAGHVLMALKHHFIDGDDTLRRMSFARRQ